jgi:Transposase IS66 family.
MPDDVKAAGLCGPAFTALVGYMKSGMHASFTTIRKFVRDVLKIKISRGQLSKLIDKVGLALDAPYDELLRKIPLEQKLNIDETGHKDNGEKFWTWCFKAELYVLFKIDKSRGSKVLIEVLGKEFDGLIGCDYFSAYRKFMKDFNINVQFCLAHLIRDIRFLLTLPDKEEKEYGKKLLAQMRKMFRLIHDNDDKPWEFIYEELKEIRNDFLKIGIEEVPLKYDKNGKLMKSKSRNLANRFSKHGEAFFQFITTPEIDPTNNIAEQAIRFVVIDRYITQGTRSMKGRRNNERLWTVLATCGIKGQSAFHFIRSAVEAYLNKASPPSLLNPVPG